jgi:phage terminase large subunit-like protein
MLVIPKIEYGLSPAQRLALMPKAKQKAFFDSLSEDDAKYLEYDWQEFWARPKQIVPPLGAWDIWLFMGGRGIGKTRTGVEAVRYLVRECGYRWISIVGRTAADVRDVLIEGESGFLNVLPDWERPLYEPSKRRLTFPNGAIANLFSADEPDQMRGPQSDLVLADEVAAWRFPDSFDQVSFGNRLGQKPLMILLTTPRPNKLMRELVEDSIPVEEYLATGDMRGKTVLLTTGSTYENAANLAPKFLKRLVKKYEGTRLGRQELRAEMLLDTPGALWTLEIIERNRVVTRPVLKRIVIAVDPPAKDNSNKEDGAEAGIIAAGMGMDGQGYILEDTSRYGTPAEWGLEALNLYYKYEADLRVGENNNGGDMVEHTVMSMVKKGKQKPNFKQVHASRGKMTRAEPISALYEKGEIHHIGAFKELEDQMTTWVPGEKSPDRLDAAVWALTELMLDVPEERQYKKVVSRVVVRGRG